MATLKAASKELFRRAPDERYASLESLEQFCREQKERSVDRWQPPQSIVPTVRDGLIVTDIGSDGAFALNDWSFSQLCRLAGVSRDTVNRLSAETACTVFRETMPSSKKPLQILTSESVRSIHGTQYSRLWNADLVAMLRDSATDFEPPQKGIDGATGLYAGEQDMFCFLIDPLGWVEIGDEAFAPGLFAWNSEVGKRSLGVQTFWFQAVCKNHIVWDATEVVDWTRKHTGDVADGLNTMRDIICRLVKRRDERKDAFAKVIANAMTAKLGDDADEALKVLNRNGITRTMAKKAIEVAQQQGALTVFSVVDALTRLAQDTDFVGLRTDAEQKASALLALAL